jgi:heme A synthase
LNQFKKHRHRSGRWPHSIHAMAPSLTDVSRLSRAERWLHRLAWACVLLMLVVTTASAWLRLAQPRPSCHDWPSCRSAQRPPGPLAQPGVQAVSTLAAVRGTHRLAASVVLLASVALVVLAWARPPRRPAIGAHALALLALALALSWLGIVTPGSRAPAVVLGNLIGGLLMLAIAWRLLRLLQGAGSVGRPLATVSGVVATLWFVQAALGAASGGGLLAPAALAHVALAIAALTAGFGVGWLATRTGRRPEGVALMLLVPLQAVLAALAVATAAAPTAVLAHNLVAAVGLALLAGLATPRPGSGSGRHRV